MFKKIKFYIESLINKRTKKNILNGELDMEFNKKDITGCIRFWRSYVADDDTTGQFIVYDETDKNFFVKKYSNITISGEGCQTELKIREINDKCMEIEIIDNFLFDCYGKDGILNPVRICIEKGKSYSYGLPSAYYVTITYLQT